MFFIVIRHLGHQLKTMIVKISVYVPVSSFDEAEEILAAVIKVVGKGAEVEILDYYRDWRDVRLDQLYE